MALLNELNLEGFSIALAYWRIGSFEWNTNDPKTIRLRVDGYASQSAYQSGSTALQSFNKELHMDLADPSDPKPGLFNEIRATCYSELKDMPDFEQSRDA